MQMKGSMKGFGVKRAADKAKKAVGKLGKEIKGFLSDIKQVNIQLDFEEKRYTLEVIGK